MHLVLILHPGYSFPHPLESFPMEKHFFHWLNQHPDNKLIVIGSTQINWPLKYAERINYYYVSCRHHASFISSLQYLWKVMLCLKKQSADRIIFDSPHTFLFFSNNPWLSFLFHRVIRNNFLILQHGLSQLSPPLYAEHTIEIPELPSLVFDKQEEKSRDQVKEMLTYGCEYFLCSARFTSVRQLTILLKAYSLFKQRLKTNFKLVLSGIQPHDKRYLSVLSNYKYRQDVIIPSAGNICSFSSILLAAYAHIIPSTDVFCPCTLADCALGRVPVIYPHRQSEKAASPKEFTFAEGEILDLADKMMRIYKDETNRKQAIQNMYEYFHQQDQLVDFSASLPNAPL
jgi:hypothetical protein